MPRTSPRIDTAYLCFQGVFYYVFRLVSYNFLSYFMFPGSICFIVYVSMVKGMSLPFIQSLELLKKQN